MVTLSVSKIENKLARRVLIVSTFLPVMIWNMLMFTGGVLRYWLVHMLIWPYMVYREARDVW